MHTHINIIPDISLIIPLYNAQHYIEDCLRSVLEQSFENYEIICVDDCSTDNTLKIVKIMQKLFQGKLSIIEMPSNSGGAACPRNLGIRLARGKYIAFLDDDDMLMPNALEIFFKIAEEMNADVVQTIGYYQKDNASELKKISIYSGDAISQPTVIPYDTAWRIDGLINGQLNVLVWIKLFRRDFLMKYDIYFPNIVSSDDNIFSIWALCLAQRYILIPDLLYIHRLVQTSLSSSFYNLKSLERSIPILCQGVKYLKKLIDHIDFFHQNKKYQYELLNYYIQWNINWHSQHLYDQYSVIDIYEKICDVLLHNTENNQYFLAYLLHKVHLYRKQLKSLYANSMNN